MDDTYPGWTATADEYPPLSDDQVRGEPVAVLLEPEGAELQRRTGARDALGQWWVVVRPEEGPVQMTDDEVRWWKLIDPAPRAVG